MRRNGTVAAFVLLVFLSVPAFAAETSQDSEMLVLRGAGYRVLTPEQARQLGLAWRDVPDSDNAACFYIQAINNYVAPPIGLHEKELEVISGRWLPDEKGLVNWLKDNRKALELVQQGALKEHCQFPTVKPTQSLLVSIPMPHLVFLKGLARLTVVQGKRLEYTGDYAGASRSYLTLLRLGVHICENPGLIQRSTGLYCIRVADRALLALLDAGRLTGPALKELIDKLETLPRRFGDYHRTIRIEGLSFTQTLATDLQQEGLEIDLAPVWTQLDEHWARLEEVGKLPTARRIKALLEFGRELAQKVQALGDEALFELDWDQLVEASGAEKEKLEKQLALVFFTQCVPGVLHGGIMYARTETRIQALRLIAGLNAYRIATGSWPGDLSTLEPRYLRELPSDPFSGKPFVYKTSKGKWILYSIDWNLKDDQGKEGGYPALWPVRDMVYHSPPEQAPSSPSSNGS